MITDLRTSVCVTMKSNLLNTADPPLANVHIIDDRTRVIFGVDPRAAATRSSVKSAEQKKKDLFTPADLLHLTSGDTFDADEQLESVSISSTHIDNYDGASPLTPVYSQPPRKTQT